MSAQRSSFRSARLLIAIGALAGCASRTTSTSGPGAAPVPVTTQVIGTMGSGSSTSIHGTAEEAVAAELRVPAPAADLWRVMPAVFEELAIPVGTMVSDARQIGHGGIEVRRALKKEPLSRFLECGETFGVPNADRHAVRMTILTTVKEAGNGSEVATLLTATAKPVGVSGNEVRCSSTGRLERRIVEVARGKLGQ